VAVASAGPYANLHLDPDTLTMPASHHSVFNRPDALPAAQTNSVKALKAYITILQHIHKQMQWNSLNRSEVKIQKHLDTT